MKKHDELRELLNQINAMPRGAASAIVTEVLKYLMDSIRPEAEKDSDVC